MEQISFSGRLKRAGIVVWLFCGLVTASERGKSPLRDFFIPSQEELARAISRLPAYNATDWRIREKIEELAGKREVKTMVVSLGGRAPAFLFLAPHRGKKPKCMSLRGRIKNRRRRIFDIGEIKRSYSSPDFHLDSALSLAKQVGALKEAKDGKLEWQVGIVTSSLPSDLRSIYDLWQASGAEGNPLQTWRALEREAVARISGYNQYYLLPNKYPVLPTHFLFVTTERDKPQCISGERELMDMISFSRALSGEDGYIIGFNGAAHTRGYGGASIRCWHCHVMRLPRPILFSEFVEPLPQESPLAAAASMKVQFSPVRVYAIRGLPSPHVVFFSSSAEHLANETFRLLRTIESHGYSYNLVVLTPSHRGIGTAVIVVPRSRGYHGGFLEMIGGIVAQNKESVERLLQQMADNTLPSEFRKIVRRATPPPAEIYSIIDDYLSE